MMWINHEIHFAWQAQHLVFGEAQDVLERCSWRVRKVPVGAAGPVLRIVNDVSYVMQFCVAGAVFGEVAG